MKTRLLLLLASLIVSTAMAAPLKIVHVNAPKINCLFNTNCVVTVADTVENFTTNLPPFNPTNLASLSGFLQSRTYDGQPGAQEAGLHAYEYRLVLQKLTGAKNISIKSMTINFSPYSSFNYYGVLNKQIWVITTGGLGSVGPSSALVSGSQVTFRFSPPIKLSSIATTETSTYFFGMVSATTPPAAQNGWASFTGTETTAAGTTVPFNFLMLHVRTP